MAHNAPGRHRAGRYNPFSELKLIAKDAAKPAAKGAVALAATGGVIASASASASAAPVAAPAAAQSIATVNAAPALSAFGSVLAPSVGVAPAAQVVRTYKRYTYKRYSYSRYSSRYSAKRYTYKRYSRYSTRYSAKRYTYKRYTSRYNYRGYRSYSNYSSGSGYIGRAGYSYGNPYRYGDCTWGAAEMWKRNTGRFPGFRGNASSWGYSARSAGYRVGYAPRARSVVVMQPGQRGSYGSGHVAWVTRARGSRITIVETNYGHSSSFHTRTINGAGLQYIYA